MTRNSRLIRLFDATRSSHRSVLLILLVSLLFPCGAGAQTVWDPSLTHAGSDGSGTWDLVTPNWASSGSNIVWPNTFTSVATFGQSGTAGTVNVLDGIKTNGLVFSPVSSGSYALTGGTLFFGGSSPTINTAADASITASLNGGGLALTKSGAGTLSLNGLTTSIP